MDDKRKIEIIGNYGAIVSAIEVGLGSLLHAFHIPFAGIFLSLNQGYLLCRASLELSGLNSSRWSAYSISNIAAVLKSLSPAGQKLGPMLSLSMQGFLFSLGTLIFGVNIFGLMVGMVLLSFWSFVQPVITYYLFFGQELFEAWKYTYQRTLPYHNIGPEEIMFFFAIVLVLKALVAIILAVVAYRLKGQVYYETRLLEMAKNKRENIIPSKVKSPFILALKDLFRPAFLLSFLMAIFFLYFSQHEKSRIIWIMLRPLAIGFIFFYFSRTLTLDRWLIKLDGGRFQHFGEACRVALAKLRKII